METNLDYFKGLSRKEYILKAYEIIKNEGIYAATTRRIAKELGCSSTCLYRYFDSREELLYFAELRTLTSYINRLNEAEKHWENVWDIYVGIWDCYAREAFVNPEAYNLLFFTFNNEKLKDSILEYYNMFPEDIQYTNKFFYSMLQTSDFVGRDFEICKRCMDEGTISLKNAIQLNRIACMLYKGYFKTILDEGINPKDVNDRVNEFISDLDISVFHLASDLQGYNGYKSYFYE
ncbi:MAG: TetR/AcrR family transcriptional regulator [Clostridium sp.]|nr:TetR/AcrR family transcriptional regulator [Clostridium sp.]